MRLHQVHNMAGHSPVETTMRYYAQIDRAAIGCVRQASKVHGQAIGHAG